MIYLKERVDFNDYDIDETESPLTCKNFVKFLKDNNIYDKFIYYLQQDINMRKKISYPYIEINNFCDEVNVYQYIKTAFLWRSTPEGYDFWNYWDDRWIYLLSSDSFDSHH